jgi:hypothetical protein
VKLSTKNPGATKNTSNNSQIIEAQGWMKTANGDVELVTMAPVVIPSGHPTTNPCTSHSSHSRLGETQ